VFSKISSFPVHAPQIRRGCPCLFVASAAISYRPDGMRPLTTGRMASYTYSSTKASSYTTPIAIRFCFPLPDSKTPKDMELELAPDSMVPESITPEEMSPESIAPIAPDVL